MTAIIKTLSTAEVQAAQSRANQIGGSASQAITPNKFVYFAAFDGTNNIRTNPAYSNDAQSTNVGQIWGQYDAARGSNPNLSGIYFPGPGTPGTAAGSSVLPMSQMQATAQNAYNDFSRQARAWLDAPRDGWSLTRNILNAMDANGDQQFSASDTLQSRKTPELIARWAYGYCRNRQKTCKTHVSNAWRQACTC